LYRLQGRFVTKRWGARVGALVAGALPVLAFPQPALWWLAWVALVPWLLLLRTAPDGGEAAWRGWLGGAGFVVALYSWLLSYVGPFGLVVFPLFGALWAPWGWLVWRCRGLAALALVPSGWIVIELVRSWHPLGGPWGLLGESQWNSRPTVAAAALGGVWLVGWLVVAVNVAVTTAFIASRTRTRAIAVAGALAALFAGPLWYAVRTDPPARGALRVALVQSGLGDDRTDRFDQAVDATRSLDDEQVDLVVWGESSVGFDLERRDDLLERLTALSAEVGADLLVNVDARRAGGEILKSAVLVTPAGIAGRYDKTRLVPFGEYIPLRPLLGWVASLTEAADEDRRRGDGPVVLHTGSADVGPLVSFELGFPDLARAVANRGADVITVQSMTSSFQSTWAPEQHAARAAVRAVETGRPVVNVAVTGVSAAFDGRGRELAWMGTSERCVAVATIALSTERTPFDRWGPWLPVMSVLALLVGGALQLRSAVSARRRER
jgi:apolipoprotein N-acyltransferase